MIRVTDITRNPATGEVTITFDSELGKTYSISKSIDLVDFTEIQGGIASGGTSTISGFFADGL